MTPTAPDDMINVDSVRDALQQTLVHHIEDCNDTYVRVQVIPVGPARGWPRGGNPCYRRGPARGVGGRKMRNRFDHARIVDLGLGVVQ